MTLWPGRTSIMLCHGAGLGFALGLHVRAVLLCGIITVRLLDEERYLSKNLPSI